MPSASAIWHPPIAAVACRMSQLCSKAFRVCANVNNNINNNKQHWRSNTSSISKHHADKKKENHSLCYLSRFLLKTLRTALHGRAGQVH